MSNLPLRIVTLAILVSLAGHHATSDRPGAPTPAAALGDDRARSSLQVLAGCFAVRYQFTEDGRGDFFFDDGVEYMDIRDDGEGYVIRNFLVYEGETFLHWIQEWTPIAQGRWRLTVKGGDGVIRYASDGVWRFNQWEGFPAEAAKPNRDSLRDDYDKLLRRNVLQFTADRWVQSEVNLKQTEGGEAVASEVGWITYSRRESDELCAPAIEFAGE